MGTGGTMTNDRIDDRIGDDWIDRMLREDAAGQAATSGDGSFTGRVMSALPAQGAVQRRRRGSHRWIVSVMAMIGCVVGLGVMSGGEELTWLVASVAQPHALSLQTVLLAAVSLGVLYWLAVAAAWQWQET
jgi:hypothetical protein